MEFLVSTFRKSTAKLTFARLGVKLGVKLGAKLVVKIGVKLGAKLCVN